MRRRFAFDLAGAGWFLLFSALISASVLLWHLALIWRAGESRAVGDGMRVESYGFDLGGLSAGGGILVASGMPKDGLRALFQPPAVTAATLEGSAEKRYRKFLAGSDRVVGVAIGGEARAYPLRVLNWHEVANDELAGRPIAVTYSPLCDSAVVFDRVVDGEVLEFGVSGLLLNSNLVMYDRRSGGVGESLWSQLGARAIAGPGARAGKRLRVLPSLLVRWEDWRRRFPQTSVVTGIADLADAYERDPYASYFGSELLRFPVSPRVPARMLRQKERVFVVERKGERLVFALSALARHTGPLTVAVGATRVDLSYREWPPAVFARSKDWDELGTYHAFWFAWYAMHPGDRLWSDAAHGRVAIRAD